jgi:hypothetical protein
VGITISFGRQQQAKRFTDYLLKVSANSRSYPKTPQSVCCLNYGGREERASVRAVSDLFVLQNDRATVSSALLQFLLLFPQQLLAAIL